MKKLKIFFYPHQTNNNYKKIPLILVMILTISFLYVLPLKAAYLPSDKDEWTEDYALSLWSEGGYGSSPAASAVHIAGDYSISTTRSYSGWVELRLRSPSDLVLNPGTDTLHFQVYADDSNEKLNLIRIFAPDWHNRFEYSYTPSLNNADWTQIDIDLSDFSVADGSPDWNNVRWVTATFWGGTTGDIKIDELY
ncbi:MAG: hypothetical protein ACXAC7_20000, partial [Candidatus Hodarchaeales archaeon]